MVDFFYGEDGETSQVPSTYAEGPKTGFISNFTASRDAAYAAGRMDSREIMLRNAYDPVTDALNAGFVRATGFSISPDADRMFRNPYRGRELNPAFDAAGGVPIDEQRIWAEIARRRQADPSFLSDLGKDRNDFVTRLNAKSKAVLDKEGAVNSGATTLGEVGSVAGSIVGSFTDAPNIVGLMLGAGPAKSIAQAVLREAAVNAGISVAGLPAIAARRSEIGAPMSVKEAAENVGTAALLGGVVGGGIEGVSRGVAHFRGKPIDSMSDGELAHAADTLPNPAPELTSAAATLHEKAGIDASNPFAPTPHGEAAHYAALSDAQHDLTVDTLDATPPVPSVDREIEDRLKTFDQPAGEGQKAQIAVLQHDIDASLAPQPEPAGVAPTLAARSIDEKIIHHESGGNPNVRNPGKGQTASGLGGITNPTWLGLWKKYVGADGLNDAQILAKKSDPNIQRQMVGYAVQEDRAALRAAGLPETDSNIFGMHFLGPRDGANLLRADANRPVSDFLPRKVIAANGSILEGKTAGDVRGWLSHSMGDRPEAPAPQMVGMGEQVVDGDTVAVTRPLDELMAEHDADDQFISHIESCLT